MVECKPIRNTFLFDSILTPVLHILIFVKIYISFHLRDQRSQMAYARRARVGLAAGCQGGRKTRRVCDLCDMCDMCDFFLM